jgi:hypothetical protein
MFQRMIDDVRDSVSTTMRLTSLATAAALALSITISFLCAAAFIYVLQNYGLIQACLTGAGVFFVVTLIVTAAYMSRKNTIKTQVRETAKSSVRGPMIDPMMLATGIQLVRAIGIKRLVPILAIGGVALGIIASRGASNASDDEPAAT